MKSILLLGGSRYLLPVIKAAKKMGIHTITCDYLPDNEAHKHSDEYHKVSVIDKDAVLALAKELQIDGIMSFACDPGVVTAAYVAEKMGLPTSPYESVWILQNKDLFRAFLTEHGFHVPKAKGYQKDDVYANVFAEVKSFCWPLIVKPIDAAGSKGVTKVESEEALEHAIAYALKFSLSDSYIIEEFIEKAGDSSDSDCFSVDGELVFASFNNQKFDAQADNPYTPAGFTWPCELPLAAQEELTKEIQRLLHLLHMGTTIYNVETRISTDGTPYIMEVSPRAGGNRLAEMLEYATGVDLIENSIRAAIGEEITPMQQPVYDGYWAEVILHSEQDGIFEKLHVAESLQSNIVESDLWVKPGDEVHGFSAANESIGTLVLRFDTRESMNTVMEDINQYVEIFQEI